MNDIIMSIPWHCGNKDGCSQGWHQANYWAYADGTYSVDSYSDGDHEDCDEDDLPSPEREQEAWLDYSEWVVEHSEDPLGQFVVRRTKQTKERYTAEWVNSLIGPRLVSVRRAGQELDLSALPEHVSDYLSSPVTGPGPTGSGVRVFSGTWESLLACDGARQMRSGRTRITFTLDGQTPRSKASVAKDLRRLARKHLTITKED